MYEYREGKVKSTPCRGVKESLKPCAYKRSERLCAVTACLLHNEPASCRVRPVNRHEAGIHSESESEEGVYGRLRQTRNRVIYTCPG